MRFGIVLVDSLLSFLDSEVAALLEDRVFLLEVDAFPLLEGLLSFL